MAPTNFQLTHAICNSQLIHTLGSLYSNLVLLPDPKNIGKAVEFRCYRVYRVYKLTNALCHIYFWLQAAIFYSPLIHIWGSLRNSLVV